MNPKLIVVAKDRYSRLTEQALKIETNIDHSDKDAALIDHSLRGSFPLREATHVSS